MPPRRSQSAATSHLANVHDMLGEVYRRAGRSIDPVEESTPLSVLLASEESAMPGLTPEDREEQFRNAASMVRRLLGWIFERGPSPAEATQRLYAVARSISPELILNMTGEEVSVIFGQGRAAESARVCLLNKKLVSAGFKATGFRHQKSATARARMSVAQLGNKNRRNSKKPADEVQPMAA